MNTLFVERKVKLESLGQDQWVSPEGILFKVKRNAQGKVIGLDEFEPAGRNKVLTVAKLKKNQ